MATLLGASAEAVHVIEDGTRTAHAAAGNAGVPYQELRGDPAATLVELAAAPDVAAVVVGSRSTPVAHGIAGHIALRLITSIEAPVVVVPPHSHPADEIRTVLVALNGSRDTTQALARSIQLAENANVEIVVLHVHEPANLPLFTEQPQHERESWSRAFLARHFQRPEKMRLELRVGTPAEQLLTVAAQCRADLIVLGWSRDLSAGHAAVVREAIERGGHPVLLFPVAPSPPVRPVAR